MVLGRRGARGNLGLLLLGTQIMNFGFQHIPPVTLGLLAGQVATFLGFFPKHFRSSRAVCISSYLVLEHKDWKRIILANFYHADDMHLYFNMVSLLYKGSMLERKFGNIYFAYLVAVFTVLTSFTYVALGFILDTVLSDQSYYLSCAVGFSGVLFALKVLTTHYSPDGTRYALGFIPVPSKYVFWAELALIQLISPNASFIGHLAGILVGLLYTKGPLKALMDSFIPPGHPIDFTEPNTSGRRRSGFTFPFGPGLFRGMFSQGRSSRTNTNAPPSASGSRSGQFYGSGRPAPSAPSEENDDSSPPRGNDDRQFDRYTGGLSEEQQYQQALAESSRQSQQSQPSASSSHSSQRLYPDLEDLRNRRSNFYK